MAASLHKRLTSDFHTYTLLHRKTCEQQAETTTATKRGTTKEETKQKRPAKGQSKMYEIGFFFGRGKVVVHPVVVVVLCATAAQQDFNLPFKSCLGQGIRWVSGLLPSHRVQPCSTVATGTLPNPLSVLRKTLESASCQLPQLVARFSCSACCAIAFYNVSQISNESTIYLCIVILQYIIELVTHAHTSRHTAHTETHTSNTCRTSETTQIPNGNESRKN